MYRNATSKKLGIFTEFKKKIFQTYILRDDKKSESRDNSWIVITEEDENLEVKYRHFVAGEEPHTFIEFSIRYMTVF